MTAPNKYGPCSTLTQITLHFLYITLLSCYDLGREFGIYGISLRCSWDQLKTAVLYQNVSRRWGRWQSQWQRRREWEGGVSLKGPQLRGGLRLFLTWQRLLAQEKRTRSADKCMQGELWSNTVWYNFHKPFLLGSFMEGLIIWEKAQCLCTGQKNHSGITMDTWMAVKQSAARRRWLRADNINCEMLREH